MADTIEKPKKLGRVIRKRIYTFGELLELEKRGEIKSGPVERARATMQEIAGFSSWQEYEQKKWLDALWQIGFPSAEINFSGFGCQGDGASFVCPSIDVAALAAFLSTEIAPNSAILPPTDDSTKEDFRPYVVYKVKTHKETDARFARLGKLAAAGYLGGRVFRIDHQYYHPYTAKVELDSYGTRCTQTRLEALVNEFEEAAETLRLGICNAIYEDYAQEYEDRMSEEALIEDSDLNDTRFDSRGQPQ